MSLCDLLKGCAFSNPTVPMLEYLCSVLLHPNDALKTSVLYAWIKLLKTIPSSAAQSLPNVIRDRVCIVLLQTLTNASSPNLINNCVGKVWKKNHLFILSFYFIEIQIFLAHGVDVLCGVSLQKCAWSRGAEAIIHF